MATYRDVKKQIAELEKQAEILRKAEAAKAIANIRTQIARFDLKPADLFDHIMPVSTDLAIASSSEPIASVLPGIAAKITSAKKPRAAAKYMDPVSRKTWNGHGKAPSWIKVGNRDDFLIAKVRANLNAPAVKTKVVAKPAPKASNKTAEPKAQAKPVTKAAAKPAAKAVAKPVAKLPAAKALPAKKPAAVAPANPAPVTKKPAPAKKPVAKAPVKKPAAKPKATPAKVVDPTPPAPVVIATTPPSEVAVAAVAGEPSQA